MFFVRSIEFERDATLAVLIAAIVFCLTAFVLQRYNPTEPRNIIWITAIATFALTWVFGHHATRKLIPPSACCIVGLAAAAMYVIAAHLLLLK